METPFHGHDLNAAKLAEDKLAGVSFDSGNREIGYLRIREFAAISYF